MISYPTKKKIESELRLGANSKHTLNGGLCLDQESSIGLNQSPYGGLINMNCDDGGMPIKRWGQSYVYPTSLGSGGINGVYPNYKGNTIIAHNTKLYKQSGSNQPVEIYSGLANSKAFFFVYNGTLYMLNGTNYIQFDGTTVKNVVPYVPKVSINRKPDGSQSTVNESWNMLGSGFTDQFNGDNTTKVFKLSFKDLDAAAVTAIVDNSNMTEGSGFTVDRVNGQVTFTNAPTSGLNNVLITAYKTFSEKPLTILKCTKAIEFSNRIFITGNADQPNFYFAGGLTDLIDASYFPEKYKYGIRGADKAVTGFAVHYNKLIVFKEDLTASVEAATGLDNTASFPITYLNTEIGCDIPDSIQLINNNVTFANTYGGVYVIISTLIPGEKNILLVSKNINGTVERPGLLQEDINDLKKATSVDHNNKYYLCVKNKVYVWDYNISFNVNKPETLTWFYYTNINAAAWFIRDNILMYGDRDNGKLIKFVNVANDFGNPILGLWKSKLMDFGYPDYEKLISDLWVTTRANSSSNISIKYYNDQGNVLDTVSIPASQLKSFNWNSFSWDNFTWAVQEFSPTLRFRPKLKGIRYFQIELSNNTFNENLSIIALVIKYNLRKRVK